jgi:hypothetical protein
LVGEIIGDDTIAAQGLTGRHGCIAVAAADAHDARLG